MAKNIVALRVKYEGSVLSIIPLSRSDRGTRFMLPPLSPRTVRKDNAAEKEALVSDIADLLALTIDVRT